MAAITSANRNTRGSSMTLSPKNMVEDHPVSYRIDLIVSMLSSELGGAA